MNLRMLAESLQDLDLNQLPQPASGPGVVGRIIQLIVLVLGALSLLFVIIGGFRYVVSQGDPGAVSKAKGTVLYALIGLAVAVLAQGIISFVVGNL